MNHRLSLLTAALTATWLGVMPLAKGQAAAVPPVPAVPAALATPPVQVTAIADGGFRCTTAAYEAVLDKAGNLISLKAGPTEFLARPAGFVRAGQFVLLKTLKQDGPTVFVAEGEPKDPAKAVANSPCKFNARITYTFNPDSITLVLEQSMDLYGGYALAPSAAVIASRDNLTDLATLPDGPKLYQQTDPRWTTKDGPVLRFDFGVWQKGFANAQWGVVNIDGKPVNYQQNTVPATAPIKITLYPAAHPAPKEALTFDISADNPDFLLPGGQPVHFNLKVTNAGPDAIKATVRFEVRDYLTKQPVGVKPTELNLAPKGEMLLPTDLPLTQPGPYRGAIVIEQDGKPVRDFSWVFTYDFQHYAPPTTRQPDFEKFWQDALAESAKLPLDFKMTPVPEKDTPQFEAFKISYATLGGRRIYGWYARLKAPGQHPAHIRFPSSGVYPLASPEYQGDRNCLWIVIHGFDVDLSNMPAGDDPGKGYWTAGIASPATSMWRTIYISLVRAVDFMAAQPQVDPKRIAVTGGSQGGGLALVAASLDHRIGLCIPGHIGLPRLDWTVKYEPGYWPFGMGAKPAGQTEEQFLKTLSYFDPANLTQDIQCPVLADVGLMDTVTASGNQICALAHIRNGLLSLVSSPWAMHGGGSRTGNPNPELYVRFCNGVMPIIPAPTKP